MAKLMKHLNKKGVALLVVLSAVAVLTTLAVDFAYNTGVSYNLASNERDRLKSFYLAKSALNFMMLELKFDRSVRQIIQQQNLGQYLGASAQIPLCQQFPMSTALIRAVFLGGEVPGLSKQANEEDEETRGKEGGNEGPVGGTESEIEDFQKKTSVAQESIAEEFLSFEGDFDAECADESTKINLNGFSGLSVMAGAEGSASPFDQYKQFLFKFLSNPQYELLFKEADVKVADVVNNIGDWIDLNTEVNDASGRIGGLERAIYDKQNLKYPVRNGKLITLLEAYLIDGVVDDWFAPLMDNFTVYGDDRVNVCTSTEDVVENLIRRYVDSTPGLPPLRLEDPAEMTRLVNAVVTACSSGGFGDQLKQQISTALNDAIGALAAGQESTQTTPPPAAGQTSQPGAQSNTGFAALISTESRFFSLKLTGQVKDNIVRIKTIVDVKEQDPKKWKFMYWRTY